MWYFFEPGMPEVLFLKIYKKSIKRIKEKRNVNPFLAAVEARRWVLSRRYALPFCLPSAFCFTTSAPGLKLTIGSQ